MVPFWSFSGLRTSGFSQVGHPGLERPTLGTSPDVPGVQDGCRPGPHTAGAVSGVQLEECNGSQSVPEARSSRRAGRRRRQGSLLDRSRIRWHHGLPDDRDAQAGTRNRRFLESCQEHAGGTCSGRYRIRMRQRRTRRSAAVRVLARGARRSRSPDQGFCQDQRQAAGKSRGHRRGTVPGRSCRRAGLAADP